MGTNKSTHTLAEALDEYRYRIGRRFPLDEIISMPFDECIRIVDDCVERREVFLREDFPEYGCLFEALAASRQPEACEASRGEIDDTSDYFRF